MCLGRLLHDGADRPLHDPRPAIAQLFAFALAARGDFQQVIENFCALLLDLGITGDDVAAVDIDVLAHSMVNFAVGRQFDRCRILATKNPTPPPAKSYELSPLAAL